ncbi:MAG TPA: gamma-glutamyl-gamma-aminobutyrate hydrolase family protein [Gaiellaceae bacterium]|jgi:gamma-glutamyl-gamma-aminobutyrate hydrolase PuuD|nr:gamma-glutamyl-gamma-aminobutyrate hydrolase family protein [Gaiellaceae bacterium]
MRPLIGITTYVTPARWSYWELEAALIPHDYVRAVEQAGGRPLLVPPSEEGVQETLDAVDGLIFSGGSDLDPEHYGAEAHPETFGVHPERDRAELDLLNAALDRDMPVLGICRGIQVLNVARGGDLHQHLPEIVGHEGHKHDPPGVFSDHDVEIEPDTKLADILGVRHAVKSHHHQGLDSVGEGLRVSAHAEDGSVEAIEDPRRRFALGVLWHPEAGDDMKLFEALVEQARDFRRARGA